MLPIPSMYGMFTYIWLKKYGKYIGKYTSPMGLFGLHIKAFSTP